MNTKEKILAAAEKLVLLKGFEKVTLTDIAKQLDISQPALYKHYKNKAEVWESLTTSWFDKITAKLLPFEAKPGQTTSEICHDWLWTLCQSKYQAYQKSPEMFALYTQYALRDPKIADYHLDSMVNSLSEATGITDLKSLRALYFLGSRYHYSGFASRWDEHFQEDFEAAWDLIEPYFKGLEEDKKKA